MSFPRFQEESGPENLVSAIVASGLVKSTDVFKPKNLQTEEKPKKISINKLSLANNIPIRRPNLLKPSVLEDIIIERQLNPNNNNIKLPIDASYHVQASMKNPNNVSDISFLYEQPKTEVTNISNRDIYETISPEEEITFPRTMLACQTLGKPQIASRANYENLNCLLKELTDPVNQDFDLPKPERIIQQREAYDTVLSEMVRQGYFECSQKGDLIQNVRSYVSDATQQLPELLTKLEKQKKRSEKIEKNLNEQITVLTHLNVDLTAQKESSELAQKSLDSRIQILSQKIPDLENELRQSRNNLSLANQKVSNLEKELSEVSDKFQSMKHIADTKSEIAGSLGNELMSMKERLSDTIDKNAKLVRENSEMKNKIENFEEKIAVFEKISEEEKKKRECEQSKIDVSTQTRQLLKERANNNNISKKNPNSKTFNNNLNSDYSNSRNTKTVSQIAEMMNDYKAFVELHGNIKINAEEFNILRDFILEKNLKFAGKTEQVIEAQKGTFELEDANIDMIRLLSHAIMDRVMDKSCHCSVKTEKSVQTFVNPKMMIEKMTNVTPGDVATLTSDAFTKLLNPQYANRPPRPFEWILKASRSIFDEKTLKDASSPDQMIEMPSFSLLWSTRQFGLDYLSQQCAWDLINSARSHQFKSLEIEMFRRFIDEEFSLNQLTFFLRLRTALLKRGFSIQTAAIESSETYTAVFLTAAEAVSIVSKVFDRTGKETVSRILLRLRERYVRKPSSTVDQNLNYIQMISILDIANDEFAKYEHLNIMTLLNCYKINPPTTGKLFTRMIRKIIPTATDEEIAEYFRISNIENLKKREITRRQLEKLMNETSLLSQGYCEEVLSLKKYQITPELELTKKRWEEIEPKFTDALSKVFAKGESPNPSVSHIAQLLRIEIDSVISSFACFDVTGAQRHMLSCLMNYQSMLWTLDEPKHETIDSITQAIKSVFNL